MRRIFIIVAIALFAGCGRKNHSAKIPKPPKLIVVIVIDQFRSDYLTRFKEHFGSDGFQYLLKDGAYFPNCAYDYATTVTSAGHTSIMTGTSPSGHGIISNSWYDRTIAKRVSSVEDTTKPVLEAKAKNKSEGRSPHRMVGTNVADEWRMATQFKAKVFGVSNKDRSAILLAGKHPSAAYWMSESAGGVFTSAYYMDKLPDWVMRYNASNPSDAWLHERWETVLEPRNYTAQSDELLQRIEPPTSYFGRTFPHNLSPDSLTAPNSSYYKALQYSPYGSDALVNFTERLIDEEKLGADRTTDILCVSFAANDEVGHTYGPDSPEVMDITIRTDRVLARLFRRINDKVGEKNVLYVLTSDHGVAPFPEKMSELGVEAGRIPSSRVEAAAESLMVVRYGKSNRGRYIARITYPDLYFDDTQLIEKKIDKEEAEDYISAALAKNLPFVAKVFSGERLKRGEVAPDKVSQAVYRSFFYGQSGDVVIVLKPYFLWDNDGYGSEHRLPYSYDAQVPLVIRGPKWIRKGVYSESVSPAVVAPILASVLNITRPPLCDHEVPAGVLKFLK